jgi:hypothetical protein
MEVVVLNCWVTETKLMPCLSNCLLYDLGEVGERSCEPINLVDHHRIDSL